MSEGITVLRTSEQYKKIEEKVIETLRDHLRPDYEYYYYGAIDSFEDSLNIQLEILEKYGIPSSFFVRGSCAVGNIDKDTYLISINVYYPGCEHKITFVTSYLDMREAFAGLNYVTTQLEIKKKEMIELANNI